MAGLTLDSGALIAAGKHNRRVFSFLREAVHRNAAITIPAGVLAQSWRGNSPVIVRLLRASEVVDMTQIEAKKIGAALAASKTSDIVDASVVVSAVKRGDAVVTSDPDDLRRVAEGLGKQLDIIEV